MIPTLTSETIRLVATLNVRVIEVVQLNPTDGSGIAPGVASPTVVVSASAVCVSKPSRLIKRTRAVISVTALKNKRLKELFIMLTLQSVNKNDFCIISHMHQRVEGKFPSGSGEKDT